MSTNTRETNDLCLATRFVWINGEGRELVLATPDGSCMYHALAYRVERRLKTMRVHEEDQIRNACTTAIQAPFREVNSVVLRKVLVALYTEIINLYTSTFTPQQAIIDGLNAIVAFTCATNSWGSTSDAANLAGLFSMHNRTVEIEDGRLKYHRGSNTDSWSGYVPVSANVSALNVYHLLIEVLSNATFRQRLRSSNPQDYPLKDKPLLNYIWQKQLKSSFFKVRDADWTSTGLVGLSRRLAPQFHNDCVLWNTGASLYSMFTTGSHNHWNIFVSPRSEVGIGRVKVITSEEAKITNSWSPQVFQLLGVGPFKVARIAHYTKTANYVDVVRSLFTGTELEIDDTKFTRFQNRSSRSNIPHEFFSQDPLSGVLSTVQHLFELSLFMRVDFVLYLTREKRMIATNQDASELPADVQHSLLTSRPARRQPRWPTYFILVDDHYIEPDNISRALALCELASPQPTLKQLEVVMRYPAILHPSLDAAYSEFQDTISGFNGANPDAPFAKSLSSSSNNRSKEEYEGKDECVVGIRSIRSSMEIGSWSCNSYRHHVDFLASMMFAEKGEDQITSRKTGFGFVDYEQALPFTCARDPWYWNNVDYLPPGSIHEIARVKHTDPKKSDLTLRDCASSSVDKWFSAKINPLLSEQKVMVLATLEEPLTVGWLSNYTCLADATIGLRAILARHTDWLTQQPDFCSKLFRLDDIKAAPAINGLAATGINQKNVRYSLLPYMRVFYRWSGVRFNQERCLPHEQIFNENWYAPFSQSPSHELFPERMSSSGGTDIHRGLANVMWHYGLYEDYIELVSAILPGEVTTFDAKIAAIFADTANLGAPVQIDRISYGDWSSVETLVRRGDPTTLVIHNTKKLRGGELLFHDIAVTAEGKIALIDFMQKRPPPPPSPLKMAIMHDDVIAGSFTPAMGDYEPQAYMCAVSILDTNTIRDSINQLISWYRASPVLGFTKAPRAAGYATHVCVIEDQKNFRAIFASRSVNGLTASTIALAAHTIAEFWGLASGNKCVLAVRLVNATAFDNWNCALCALEKTPPKFDAFVACTSSKYQPVLSQHTLSSVEISNYFANS